MLRRKHHYMFLFLRTGGGHLAPARSVAQFLKEHYGDKVQTELVDGLAEAAFIARYIIEDGYRMLQAKAKWYYEFLYATNKFPPIGYFNVFIANFFIKPYIFRKILTERPTKIVIFHFFLIAPVYQVLKRLRWKIPVVTVVTDPFTAHPLWFQRKDQQFIVFSERLYEHCRSRGIPADALRIFPFIINEKFTESLPSERIGELRTQYGFTSDKPVVLIIGGGDGIPHGKKILQQLLAASVPAQIAIVCGKNKELYNDAVELKKQFPQLIVFGFVDVVYELLNVADIVITKCGASTIMEVLMLQKVPIIIDYLWEQELGNMEFVRDNSLGIFERDISKLPEIVRDLCLQPDRYAQYRSNIEQQVLRNGTRGVAEYIIRFPATEPQETLPETV